MSLTLRPISWAILVLTVLSLAQCCNAFEGLVGTRQSCDEEGATVTIDKIPNTKCFNCTCKGGFVECAKQQCPELEGCYAVQKQQQHECCRQCAGCLDNGVHHQSGTEWTNDDDPCAIKSCNAGVTTTSRLRCYTPCVTPIPAAPGQCCPSCTGCSIKEPNGTLQMVNLGVNDPCVLCRCDKGLHACYRKACPVLNCPPSRVHQIPGQCCPHCRGFGQLSSTPKDFCRLGADLHEPGAEFSRDECTRCHCRNSTVTCTKETCPVLECPIQLRTRLPGQCCTRCPVIREDQQSCAHEGRSYKNGESWKVDRCRSCFCDRGNVRCATRTCPPIDAPCQPDSERDHEEDHCCQRCGQRYGVCTVFGDPHYRTFDGKFFTFEGSCRYQLVGDCVDHRFSVRVTNDARQTTSSAWTKAVLVRIDELRVNLGRKMRVKVNGTRVEVPYVVPNVLDISRTSDSVIVSTRIGIKVLWDGISLVEVSASGTHRGRLCGLCGNFNDQPGDDFTMRSGQLVEDPDQFGQSWSIGSRKSCPRTRSGLGKALNDQISCNRLRTGVFESCNEQVDPRTYYESCLHDMSECPTEQCCCESFVAYAHECQRHGLQLTDWRNSTRCRTSWDS